MKEQDSISALFGAVSVKIQTIELIAKLIKNNKQNELVQKEYDIQKVKEYADNIIQLSSEILGLLGSTNSFSHLQETKAKT